MALPRLEDPFFPLHTPPFWKHRASFDFMAPLLSSVLKSYPHGISTMELSGETDWGGEGKDGMQEVTRFVPLWEFMLWEGVKTIFTSTMHRFGSTYSLLCKRNICRNRSIRNFHDILWQYLWELNMPYPINSTSVNLLYGYMWTCIQRTMYAQWYCFY